MSLRKCSRCELNYILDDAAYCPVCMRELKGELACEDTLEMCSICNENPSLPGKDLCLFCLKELEEAEKAGKDTPKESPLVLDEASELVLDEASEMEEIAIDEKNDIPDGELGEIDRELSLDDVLAEESEGEDDETDDGEDM